MTARIRLSGEESVQETDFKAFFNEGVNMTASVGSYVLNPTLKTAAVVGTVVSVFFGLGAHLGLLQGVLWALYRECIHIPIREYLNVNGGKEDGKIHPQTYDFITCAVEIGSIVIPIFITGYCGQAFGAFLSRYVITQCLVQTGVVYTLFSGLLIWGGLYGALVCRDLQGFQDSTLDSSKAQEVERK